jgi:demethylmenaquinone methyltransferase / 2-methoxy-6-polyprenyl-1,4-benzoquinol methylase
LENSQAKKNFFDIGRLFSNASFSYDLMNDVLSLGSHHLWKFSFVQHINWSQLPQSFRYADMACGSADIGRMVLQRMRLMKKQVTFFFIDPNPDMIAQGQQKNICSLINWRQESAENCSLPSNSLHLYTLAFGLRNTVDRLQVLRNAKRMLVPGGQFWCLEFAWPSDPLFAILYDAYLGLLPSIGHKVARQARAYAYLAESIRAFPAPSVIEQEIQEVGFTKTGHRCLSKGLVAIFWGYKEPS